ncbi:hypothetical protein TIFTF001_025255 [Ficus carica]|uniref:Transmembrane protein n=1 Tax=Ficus carica TaxID=3494 RepID=A0AA88AMN7_FICCA|nr:hypothetical protein TIFTF001_025255 [Ficus carica]
MDTTRAGLRSGGEGVGSMRGPVLPIVGGLRPSRTASFPPCCWLSFLNGPITPMVASALMGVALPKVFVLIWVLLIRFSHCLAGCCLVADLAFMSSVVGVFLCVWDRGSCSFPQVD